VTRRRRALPRQFFERATLDVARDLIGKVLVHETRAGVAAGRIVEVEAYIGEDDPACHAAPGPTRRNEPLYGRPGIAYVYLNYGIHFLTNVVTEADGFPAAVLLRALEPCEGMDLMQRRRTGRARGAATIPVEGLCRGPGNLSKALGITLKQNRLDMTADSPLRIEDWGLGAGELAWGPRIGIRVGVDKPWRCYERGCPAVSNLPGARKR
jgi:DNA-3-methyladenine glycosylase